MLKKIFAFIGSIILCFSITAQAREVPGDFLAYAESSANRLYELGLFRGVGQNGDGSPDFALTSRLTRGEAVTMLVRMLGAESDALSRYYGNPFTDTGWADMYIDYAYGNGIAFGVSDTEFGTDDYVTLEQLLTFALRALGYIEVDWQNPYGLADSVGLIYARGDCYRADAAIICASALDCTVNGTDMTLFETLYYDGAINAGSTPVSGFGPVTEPVMYIEINSGDELMEKFGEVVNGRASQIIIYVPEGQESFYAEQLNSEINRFCDVQKLSSSWYPNAGEITVTIIYDSAVSAMAYLEGKLPSLDDDTRRMLNEAIKIHSGLVYDSMTPYDKVKAIHDYLVNTITYRNTGSRGHSAVGALLDGLAVCDGYAEAFDLMCYLSNIPCIQVGGTAFSSGGAESHLWNKVYLDGAWYNVDVTWDDPVSSVPVLSYDYFLVSDAQLARDHSWTMYPQLPVSESNYF